MRRSRSAKQRYMSFVESLDHTVVMLAANHPTRDGAREAGLDYIRAHPRDWQEFDTLRVVEQVEDIDVSMVAGA